MSLSQTIHRGIDTIRRVAGGLRTDVTHVPMTDRDAYGPVYLEEGVPMQALVEHVSQSIRLPDGAESVATLKLTFFEPVEIKEADRFDAPDGAGNVVRLTVQSVKALLDPDGWPYMVEVWLGEHKRV